MRKILCTLTFAALAAGASAQSTYLRGGVNLANVSITNDGRIDEGQQLTTFQVGMLTDIPITGKTVALQTGLIYTGKGSELQNGTEGQAGYFKQTSNPFYLEVPATLLFKTGGANAKNRLFIGAGPYFAVGIGGKNKTEGRNLLGVNFRNERKIVFSDDDPTTLNEEEGRGFGVLRRFDYGANGTVGIEGASLIFSVNYGLGMANLQSGANSSADDSNKHRVLGVTLGIKI